MDGTTRAGRRFDRRWLVVVAFVVIEVVTISRHEMWRDELQAWMIVRSSHSITNLFVNMRYEGHPALWYLLLLPVSKVSRAPQAMQVVQFVIAIVNLWLVVRFAPFSFLQKALFAGGYFVVFEYGVISRSYSLGALLVTISCVVATSRHRWPWVGVPLALLASTSAFGSLVAVALLAGLCVDWWVSRRADGRSVSVRRALTGCGIVVVAVVLAYIQAAPRKGAGVYLSWKTSLDLHLLSTSLAAISRALAPIPKLRLAFWATSVFDGHTALAAIAGCVVFAGIAWLCRERPGACVIWVIGCVLVVGFLYSKIQFADASRYNGHIFLLLMAAIWLIPSMAGRRDGKALPILTKEVWTAVLIVQLIAGIFAVSLDLAKPFSNGKAIAGYIRSNHLADSVIIGVPDTTTLSVAAYLDRPLYHPEGRRFGEYIVWDMRRQRAVDTLPEAIGRFATTKRVVLVLSSSALTPDLPDSTLRLLTSRKGAIVGDENFWLYRVQYTH